jgi:very-short-patch-repair endonuclease
MGQSFKTASPLSYDLLKEHARTNRKEMTQAEQILWESLRENINSYKFRRQHPIGDYIADCVCITAKIIIEVDGEYHNEPQQQQDDLWRTEFLEKNGFRVIRFSNDEVIYNLSAVINHIKEELSKTEDE